MKTIICKNCGKVHKEKTNILLTGYCSETCRDEAKSKKLTIKHK